jgi:hypothetical protein
MVGIRGANMKRLMKVRKKRTVRKITVPNMAEKGSGVGHALSVMKPPEGWKGYAKPIKAFDYMR